MVPHISFHTSNIYYDVTTNKTQAEATLQTMYTSKHRLEKVLLQKPYTSF